MELNYTDMARLIDIRMKQIHDAALEIDYFNKEFIELQKMRDSITELILLERYNPEEYKETGWALRLVDKYKPTRPKPSEVNPPQELV
jgi:hypothetical protein